MIVEASYYEKLEDSKVRCTLCPYNCLLTEGKIGICKNRFNKEGKLLTNNYAEVVTMAVDPIEKKPLYHFHPGSMILSTGPNGCNFGCLNCQNWTISQQEVKTVNMSPEALTRSALEHDSIGVAFTYTEPFIWFEYLRDSAKLLKEKNLKVIIISNGFINQEPLKELLPYVDAMNLDLKSINDSFYKRICKGMLQPVLDTITAVAKSGVHLEITNLLIPTLNDSENEIESLAKFIASLDKQIPLHISAYHPDYKLDYPKAESSHLRRAYDIASDYLDFVYLGNIASEVGQDTICPNCKNVLISRSYYLAQNVGLKEGKCTNCDSKAAIIQ